MSAWDELLKREEFRQREPAWAVVRFAKLLKERGLRRVLDLGCGAGRHLAFLAKEGFEVVGLDSSPVALELSHRRLEEEGLIAQAELIRADMTKIPYPDGSFDAAIAIAAIYHGTLSQVRQAVSEIHRVLRPGGWALIEFKSKRSYRYGKGQEIEPDTFIADSGGDAGIPHHYSDRAEVEQFTRDFILHEINHMEQIFEGKYRSARWEVWLEKP